MPAWQNPKATAAAVGAPAPQATAAVPAPAGEAGEAGDSTAASGAAAARRGGTSREAWNGANSTAGATSAVFATCDSKAAAPSSEALDRPSLIADTERICSDCGKAFNVNDVASFNRHVCSRKGGGLSAPVGAQASGYAAVSCGATGLPAVSGLGVSSSATSGAGGTGAQLRGQGAQPRGANVPPEVVPTPHAGAGPSPPPPGHPFSQGVMPPVSMVWRCGGPMPHAGQQFQTELLLLQETSAQGERMRNHREALKVRLAASAGGAQGGLTLDELEHSVRCMIVGGRFAGTQGIPESAIIGLIPDKYIQPPSPFRTIAELAASVTWLLRVHQSMQWVQQMPNGLMTVQRLVCPAASEMGGLAAPDGVLAIDWQCIDQVMARPEASQAAPEFRPGLQGDPRFPRPPTAAAATGPELGAIAAEADAEADAEAAELVSKLA